MMTPQNRVQPASLQRGNGKGADGRLFFLDNLRSTMILLVISMHAADTYSPLGNWYFVDRVALTRLELLFFAAWQMYLQSFFMGLLFLIAGYFVPSSLQRKGARRFIRDRLVRLGLPVLFYIFVLGPVTEYFVAGSWTSTEPTSFWREWLKHIRNWEFLSENGPLWFCLVLLIFTLIYVLLPKRSAPVRDLRNPFSTPRLIGFASIMAALTFVIRLLLPPNLVVFNMHLGDFGQYVLLFGAGILASRNDALQRFDARMAFRWILVVLPVGFAGWLALLFGGGALRGNTAPYGGGWHWQAAGLNLWEAFTCVAICAGLLVLYREKLNRPERLAAFLSTNAFSVYVFHPPILILCARLLHFLTVPPVAKFAVLTVLAASVSFALSAAVFRRIPLLRSIL